MAFVRATFKTRNEFPVQRFGLKFSIEKKTKLKPPPVWST